MRKEEGDIKWRILRKKRKNAIAVKNAPAIAVVATSAVNAKKNKNNFSKRHK